MGRYSAKEQAHFLEIAFGSLMETYSQLLIALGGHYITEDDLQEVKELIAGEARLLSGLRNSISRK